MSGKRKETTTSAAAEIKSNPVKKTAAKKADGFCVYIGPTIIGVIQSGTVYRGTKSEVLASIAPVIERYPLVTALIVSQDTLPVDRIKVKTPGNLLYMHYNKLAQGKK